MSACWPLTPACRLEASTNNTATATATGKVTTDQVIYD